MFAKRQSITYLLDFWEAAGDGGVSLECLSLKKKGNQMKSPVAPD